MVAILSQMYHIMVKAALQYDGMLPMNLTVDHKLVADAKKFLRCSNSTIGYHIKFNCGKNICKKSKTTAVLLCLTLF